MYVNLYISRWRQIIIHGVLIFRVLLCSQATGVSLHNPACAQMAHNCMCQDAAVGSSICMCSYDYCCVCAITGACRIRVSEGGDTLIMRSLFLQLTPPTLHHPRVFSFTCVPSLLIFFSVSLSLSSIVSSWLPLFHSFIFSALLYLSTLSFLLFWIIVYFPSSLIVLPSHWLKFLVSSLLSSIIFLSFPEVNISTSSSPPSLPSSAISSNTPLLCFTGRYCVFLFFCLPRCLPSSSILFLPSVDVFLSFLRILSFDISFLSIVTLLSFFSCMLILPVSSSSSLPHCLPSSSLISSLSPVGSRGVAWWMNLLW